jgi:hypothetical protein
METLSFSPSRTAIVLLAVGILMSLDLTSRSQGKRTHYLFGSVLGTALSFSLIQVTMTLVSRPEMSSYGIGLGVLALAILWRMLFGAWDSRTKATVLGAFVFWVAFHILVVETSQQRLAHVLAILIALIPAVVWCALFLPYHRERLSVVFCMFFAGMLSTMPILFYDALLRKGVTLHFFLFSVTPESFSMSSHQFVANQWPSLGTTPTTVASLFLSFVLVGLIEEGGKFWVFRRAGKAFVSSIDDCLQLAILVAIGFAFAENVTNSGYFLSFVKQYLLIPDPEWTTFLANIAGRSILTSMVHIVSTGILGYFAGLAIFAGSYLQDRHEGRIYHAMTEYLHRLLGIPAKTIFARTMVLVGFFFAVFAHALSNFLVSLPESLPGNPHTVGELFGSAPGGFLHMLPLLLFPTFLYVVGGFFLLTSLFLRKENMKERGHVILVDTFVTEEGGV